MVKYVRYGDIMKWSLQQLYKYQNEALEFSDVAKYDEYIKSFSDIIRMDDVHYSGTAICVNNDMYRFNLHIETIMYLEDARTLEEVPYPINLDVEEVFTKDERFVANDIIDRYDNDYRYIEKNTIDLYDVVWENIILEKPISITKE